MRDAISQSQSRRTSPSTPIVRCAIYTRKSTTEGLDSDFNTLDAQWEACLAYIASQRSEGWLALSQHYDDGGFTGSNIERPALQQLLNDIKGGEIDCVVVYKVDRLSRSLLDFARLIEVFDRQKVVFVSVTQQFNTANSMGRLVLNVLLSFAQFEREIISERTSDKMCAARRKGKWLGGPPVLGYDIDRERKRLVVVPQEAIVVQEIFGLYLQTKSMMEVAQDANRRGWTTKSYVTKKGALREGLLFDKTKVQRILTNATYIGKVNHKGRILPGEQASIVDDKLFQQVQDQIETNRHSGGKEYRHHHTALLKKLLRCGTCGAAMAHTYAKKGNKLYRYYLCTTKQKRGPKACDTPFLPASELDACVVALITRIGQDPELTEKACRETVNLRETRLAVLIEERQRLALDVQQHEERIAHLLAAINATTDPPRTLLEQLRSEESLADQARGKLDLVQNDQSWLEARAIDTAHIVDALTRFESMWSTLAEIEQARLLQRLLACIVFHPTSGEIALEFRSETPVRTILSAESE